MCKFLLNNWRTNFLLEINFLINLLFTLFGKQAIVAQLLYTHLLYNEPNTRRNPIGCRNLPSTEKRTRRSEFFESVLSPWFLPSAIIPIADRNILIAKRMQISVFRGLKNNKHAYIYVYRQRRANNWTNNDEKLSTIL